MNLNDPANRPRFIAILEGRHQNYEKRLDELKALTSRTLAEQAEMKILKHKKLRIKDTIARVLAMGAPMVNDDAAEAAVMGTDMPMFNPRPSVADRALGLDRPTAASLPWQIKQLEVVDVGASQAA